MKQRETTAAPPHTRTRSILLKTACANTHAEACRILICGLRILRLLRFRHEHCKNPGPRYGPGIGATMGTLMLVRQQPRRQVLVFCWICLWACQWIRNSDACGWSTRPRGFGQCSCCMCLLQLNLWTGPETRQSRRVGQYYFGIYTKAGAVSIWRFDGTELRALDLNLICGTASGDLGTHATYFAFVLVPCMTSSYCASRPGNLILVDNM